MAKLTKRTIKHPFFRYRAEVTNPRRPGETRIAVRTARTGEEVELMPEDLAVGEEHGAFYSDKELKLVAAGMSHEAIAILSATGKAPEYVDNDAPNSDDSPSEDLGLADGLEDEDDDGDELDVDLDELEGDELSEAVEGMTIPDLVEAVGDDAELAQRVLAADAQATGGDPRKGLQHELDKVIAAAEDDED